MSFSTTSLIDPARDGASDTRRGKCVWYGATSPSKPPAPRTYPGVWDREFDGPHPKRCASCGLSWLDLIEIAARVGLALFLTGGFAIAVNLYTGHTLRSPDVIQACEHVFLWTLALVSCGFRPRCSKPCPGGRAGSPVGPPDDAPSGEIRIDLSPPCSTPRGGIAP
jgi:hypothetical protein